jgi:hypothetical protein
LYLTDFLIAYSNLNFDCNPLFGTFGTIAAIRSGSSNPIPTCSATILAESKPRSEVKIADETIREKLSRMLESPIFVQSDRLARFLRFTVETTLAGHYRPGSYVPAFRRRDNQEGGGLATDRALRELLTEGLLAKALEVPPVSREINLQTVFEGTARVLRLRAES